MKTLTTRRCEMLQFILRLITSSGFTVSYKYSRANDGSLYIYKGRYGATNSKNKAFYYSEYKHYKNNDVTTLRNITDALIKFTILNDLDITAGQSKCLKMIFEQYMINDCQDEILFNALSEYCLKEKTTIKEN